MNMTHYMELLAVNQPWNLLIFMAVPIVAAETVAVTELRLLWSGRFDGPVRVVNRVAGAFGGIYFVGIFIHLFINVVVPLTRDGGWRGPADVIAVGAYLSGVVPLAGMALLDLGLVARGRSDRERLGIHASLVGVFLVVAHIAMIFGMLDPTILAPATGHMGGHGMG